MKKILLALGTVSLLLACGDDDSGSSYDLSTASIANASIIYKRAATTRAANGSDEDEGYWKIDRQGNETRILLYDKAGNPTDVKIEKIEKLNEKLLLIETNSYPLRMIADLQTEKLYQAPDVLDTPVKEDPDGMLYFVGKWIDAVNNQMLYKLDPVQYEAAVKGAEASIEKCKAELTYAQSNYNRLNLLYEKQATSLDTLESAKATLGAAKAALLSAEAELITAKDNLKNTVITAPRRGSSASPPIRRATTSRPIPAHCSPSSRPSRYGSASPSASPTFSACSAPTGN